MLVANNIHKQYDNLAVLKGVDITINKGELISIIGSSGAGKSTLLHILGTLDKPDTGEILMNNQPLHRLQGNALAAFRNKHIGFVFQFHHLLPEFSAIENVCVPGWIANRKKTDVYNEAKALLNRLGLENKIDNKPNQLSGGEQQRVAVARALINKPDIVFADEPTGNLDSQHAKDLHNLFVQLCNEYHQTFVIVTHNEELAAQSQRILKMMDGKIV